MSGLPGRLKAQTMPTDMRVAVKIPGNVTATTDRALSVPVSSNMRHYQISEVSHTQHQDMYSMLQFGIQALWPQTEEIREELMIPLEKEKESFWKEEKESNEEKKTFRGFKLKMKVGNASLRKLLSGAFAGAVSRTAVAPLETIRTHLMVGNAGQSVGKVFSNILEKEGWQGLFRGNGINVIRVTPSKAIELFAYETVKKSLMSKEAQIPVPIAVIAGATAGVCSTICTYPLELLKTRFTIQRGAYSSLANALVKIIQEEGAGELYRGLLPSIVGVIPYSGINYLAYDSLRKAYRKMTKRERIGNLETLFMGSLAGVISGTATFPLEVARKQMQMGSGGNLFEVLRRIVEQQGPSGLYRGLGASCIKVVPAAGISFMCYEACKRILSDDEQQQQQQQQQPVTVVVP